MADHTDPKGYAIVDPDTVENPYDGSDVPGEFRRLTDALGCEQLSTKIDDFWEASPRAAQRASD